MSLCRVTSIALMSLVTLASGTLYAAPQDADLSVRRPREMQQRSRNILTAEDQSSREQSIEITRAIRQALVKRDDLSIHAKNIQIITDDNGNVTLKGSVRSSQERSAVDQIARSSVGIRELANELQISANEDF